MQAQIVHITREGRADVWEAVDSAGNVIQLVFTSLEQMRIALGVICLALDMPILEVRE